MFRYVSRFLTINLLAVFLSVFSQSNAVAQPNGEALFKANCTSCHGVGDNKIVGPGLKNVHLRRSEEWLLKWIKNSSAFIKSGDADAIKVYEENNKVAMPAFNLSDDELKAMIGYIKTESEKAPAAPAPGTAAPAGAPTANEDDNSPLVLLLVTALLVAIYFILNRVKQGLEKVVRQREGVAEPIKIHGKAGVKHWIREHKKLIAVLLVIGVVFGSVKRK
jgi:mono/diheme cytochrome c family protein